MVSLIAPRSARPQAAPGSVPIALAGPLAALQAAVLGLLVVTVVVLTGWASAPLSDASATDALRAAAQGWLLAHHTDLAVPGGRITMAPLGLLLLPGGLLLVAAGRAARAAGVDGMRRSALLTLAICLPYAVVAALAAVSAGGAGGGQSPWVAGAHALVISAAAAGVAVGREAGLAGRLLERLPAAGRAMLVGAGAGVLAMIGSGALIVAVALLWHHRRHVDLIAALSPGGVGGVLLTGFGVLLLINAAVWGAAYALGPGFAVGIGTAVAPGGVALGTVPAVPLLTALPESGPGSPAGYAVLVVPVLAGVLIGVTVGRRPTSPRGWIAVGSAAGAGALTGLLLGALAWCSGGSLGGGRMAELGPSWWQVALVGMLVLGPVAALTALCHRRWATRRSPEPASSG